MEAISKSVAYANTAGAKDKSRPSVDLINNPGDRNSFDGERQRSTSYANYTLSDKVSPAMLEPEDDLIDEDVSIVEADDQVLFALLA